MGGSSKSSSTQNYADKTKNINLQDNTNSPVVAMDVGDLSRSSLTLVDPGSVALAQSISVKALDLASQAEAGANSRVMDAVGQGLTFAEESGRAALDFASNYTPPDNSELIKYGLIGLVALGAFMYFGGVKHA